MSCWQDSCRYKRNYYRTQARKLDSKKKKYYQSKGTEIEVEPKRKGLWCQVIIYSRYPTKDEVITRGVSAVAFQVFQASNLIHFTNPIPCHGFTSYLLQQQIETGFSQIESSWQIEEKVVKWQSTNTLYTQS